MRMQLRSGVCDHYSRRNNLTRAVIEHYEM